MRSKKVQGFATGDLLRAHMPKGKIAGVHRGREEVRPTDSFNIQTGTEVVQGIGHRYCTILQRDDCYGYHMQSPPAISQPEERSRSFPSAEPTGNPTDEFPKRRADEPQPSSVFCATLGIWLNRPELCEPGAFDLLQGTSPVKPPRHPKGVGHSTATLSAGDGALQRTGALRHAGPAEPESRASSTARRTCKAST